MRLCFVCLLQVLPYVTTINFMSKTILRKRIRDRPKWKSTAKRFVAFFDVMGFKDMVARNSHSFVLEKLHSLEVGLSVLDDIRAKKYVYGNTPVSETHVMKFSDSIVIFTESDTEEDANKIILDSALLLEHAFLKGIPMKGAISYGEVTVDFNKFIFFGQPIIDAYLLHEQLFQLSVVLDHNFEKKISTMNLCKEAHSRYRTCEVSLKGNSVTHQMIQPADSQTIKVCLEKIDEMYLSVSGSARRYLGNTKRFLEEIQGLSRK